MKIKVFILSIIILFICACGGGSAGTGTTTVSGQVRDLQDQPINGVTVTIINTGDSSITNNNGEFSILTSAKDDLQLELNSQNGSDVINISNTEGFVSEIQVDVKLDPQSGKVQDYGDVSLSAGIYGACDRYFENTQIIRQSNALRTGAICTIKVWLSERGVAKGGVPIGLEAAGCAEIRPWKTENQVTSSSSGVTQMQFEFKNDPSHCQYRIIAPYTSNAKKQKSIYIHTLAKQDYEQNKTN